jgi:sugar lactone lactonase YvrE
MVRRFIARPVFRPESEELRYLPECPRMLRNGMLGWVAIQHGTHGKASREGSIHLLDLASGRDRGFPLPGRPGFFAPTTREGTVLIGLERRLVLFNFDTGELQETGIHVPDHPEVIINDGLAIADGLGLIFGTKHLAFERPVAALYHLDTRTGELRQLLDGQTCSNGKYFLDDILIDIDTQPKHITRYRFDAGLRNVLERRLVTPPHSLPAMPDGLRPTADGESVIVAFYNPAAVSEGLAQEIRLADGAVLTEWTLPGSPRVTCPEFARIDGKLCLLFTTAVEGMPAAIRKIAPDAGALFCAETPFTELPEPPPLFVVGQAIGP